MSEKMNEQEAKQKAKKLQDMRHRLAESHAKQKAKKLQDMHHRLAESHAEAFVAWLNENKDATKEEAHERLTQTIEMAIMLSMMSLVTL